MPKCFVGLAQVHIHLLKSCAEIKGVKKKDIPSKAMQSGVQTQCLGSDG